MDSNQEITLIENSLRLLISKDLNLPSRNELAKAMNSMYTFPDFISISQQVSPTFSPENLFFLLYNKKYISGANKTIDALKEDYQIGLKPSLNGIRFHLTDKVRETFLFLIEAKEGVDKTKAITNKQLTFGFDQPKGDQNICHDLPIQNLVSKDLDELVNMQKALQLRIDPSFCDPGESIASIAEFLMKNKHAFEEEMIEMMNALGGTHDPVGSSGKILGSGAWKWWKESNRTEARAFTINALSGRDRIELKMEIVDQFHFFMNQMIKIGMSGSELYSMYMAKNAENFNRQNNGY